jgi:hypothetical protein
VTSDHPFITRLAEVLHQAPPDGRLPEAARTALAAELAECVTDRCATSGFTVGPCTWPALLARA